MNLTKRAFPKPLDIQTKFSVIYADPCWTYSQYRDSANGAAISAYKCMSTDQLISINPARWAADDCLLALWSTGPMIAQGEMSKLVEGWGFKGKSMVPWLKNEPTTRDLATGPGIWFMGNAEYLVFATRGNVGGFFKKGLGDSKPRRLRGGNLGILIGERESPHFWQRISERTIIYPKDRKHSRKPVGLADYISTFEGKKMELFARSLRPGFDAAWGTSLGHDLGPWGVRPYTPPVPKNGLFAKEHT